MKNKFPFTLLLDIDGLRYDVFAKAIEDGLVPNIQELLKANHLIKPLASTAPSITFCAQASIFTGTPPKVHGIVGNQFFDRFGKTNKGTPRFYAFDDAIRVFTEGFAAKKLAAPTMYEELSAKGVKSVVAGNMYATGAHWIKPSIVDLARLTKMPEPFKLEPPDYDSKLLSETLAYIEENGIPDVLTYYLKGLDDHAHRHGPATQLDYLTNTIDPEIGRLWTALCKTQPEIQHQSTVLIFSDHGQIETIPDDQHALRLAFPFEKELAPIFEAFELDVHDYPGEGPNSDAIVAMNGGLAQIYLRNRAGAWSDIPDFQKEVLPIAQAFWHAHLDGKYTHELKNSLAAIFVKNVEQKGWDAPYEALTPQGALISLEAWFEEHHPQEALDPINRLEDLTCENSGDVILVSNYVDGYYFSPPNTGTHGGLHKEDSTAFIAASWADQSLQAQAPQIEDLANGLSSIVDIKEALYKLILYRTNQKVVPPQPDL